MDTYDQEKRRRIPCPVCVHEETMRARLNGGEPCHDDIAEMLWHRPAGVARGQVISRMDGGWWQCVNCDVMLTPHEAGVLLDAALMHAFQNCDSISDGVHADVRVALSGR